MLAEYKQMLKKYEDNLAGSSETVRKHYLQTASRFLEYASGKSIDRPTVFDYLKKMKRDKYADGTVNFHYRTINTFLRLNDIKILARKDAPVIKPTGVRTVRLDIKLVEEMIQLDTKLTPQEAAFLAMSTIYGLRRSELVGLTPECFDFNQKLVFVESVKGSRQRYHLIPPEIESALRSYDFGTRITNFKTNALFWEIGKKIEMEFRGTETNWHSIRRTLDRRLMELLPYHLVRGFLRWKVAFGDMPGHYYSANLIMSREDTKPEMDTTEKEQDQRVFAVHPFLPIWKELISAKKTKRGHKTLKT